MPAASMLSAVLAVSLHWATLPGAPALAAEPNQASSSPPGPGGGSICGRTGDVSRLLLELQKPALERLWRDTKLFVVRDHDDGSLWAFSIKNSTVHPAVRCRRARAGSPSQTVDVGLICPASDAACASFAAQADEKFDSFGAVAGAPR